MTITIRDIARDLQLDGSTVSYALAGKGRIAEATRRRILEHAAQIGYRPNRIAQRMRSSKTGVIGLIVPDVMFAYVEVVQHLFREVAQSGRELQIGLSEFNGSLEDQALKMMMDSRVDGIIVKTNFVTLDDLTSDRALPQVLSAKLPILFYGMPPEKGLPYVVEPFAAAAKAVAEHLLDQGHRHLSFLLPMAHPYSRSGIRRIEGIQQALAARGLPAQNLAVFDQTPEEIVPALGQYREHFDPDRALETGRTLFRRAMQHTPRPTAIIAYSDVVAIGAIMEAQAMGLRVPQDVAIAGTQKVPTSVFSPIKLTTVSWRPASFAKELLRVLDGIIDQDPEVPREACGGCDLVIGASTVAV